MPEITLGPAGEVAEGAMRAYKAGDRRVLVAHVAGAFYALDAKCPHLGGDLSRGKLDGHIVICPLHGSRFDVRDGSVIAWVDKMSGVVKGALTAIKGPNPATTYRVRVQDGNLVIEMPA
jgi:3-phenylpropionate/trans-cinnamate dioxygenase ferredoxin subunit